MVTRIPRTVTFLPGLAAAGWGWDTLHQPYHLEGLAVLGVAALLAWPLIVLAAVFGLPALLMWLMPPRPLRRWWRARHPGVICWLMHWATGSPVGRSGARSAYIPMWLVTVVYAADRHRCVWCGNRPPLNVDHLMPWSLGGLTVLFNLMTLCDVCNLAKSNAWIYHGRFWPGHSAHPEFAEDLIRFERRHRYNPARWLRAAWALGA